MSAAAWSPLRHSVFRALWVVTIISNVGTWMQNVAAAWLMTSLSQSSVMVALVQTATSLPVFFLALPAGALADVVDRRRLLLLTQGWMLVMAMILGAIRAGLRYARHAPELQAVLVRAGAFILCGAALWALLPLRSKNELGYDATGYGALLGCLGAGALIGAGVLPTLRSRLANDAMISCTSLLFGVATLGLAFLNNFFLLCGAMLIGGLAWMTGLSRFNVAAVAAGPAWGEIRSLGVV